MWGGEFGVSRVCKRTEGEIRKFGLEFDNFN